MISSKLKHVIVELLRVYISYIPPQHLSSTIFRIDSQIHAYTHVHNVIWNIHRTLHEYSFQHISCLSLISPSLSFLEFPR